MEPYFLMSLSAIGVLLVGIGSYVASSLSGIKATQGQQGEKLVRIETVLLGPEGTNGMNGDVKELKAWRQEQDEHALPRRVTDLERRHGAGDRRQAHA
jgi:hypothetical protein